MGLAAANVLQRLGHSFTVYEKFTGPFTERGSSLGYVDIPLWWVPSLAALISMGKE